MYSAKEKKKSHFNRQKTGFIKVNKGRVVKYYGQAISESWSKSRMMYFNEMTIDSISNGCSIRADLSYSNCILFSWFMSVAIL